MEIIPEITIIRIKTIAITIISYEIITIAIASQIIMMDKMMMILRMMGDKMKMRAIIEKEIQITIETLQIMEQLIIQTIRIE